MNYPSFFNDIETITLQDKLSSFLGSFEEGIVEFSFADIAKCSGHACPTVLSAYLMVREGLKALYKEELPQRGEIIVEFADNENEGVAGVIANVVTNITGATSNLGFKGIGGNFDRRNLMRFESNINGNIKLIRRDTQESVEVYFDGSSIPANPEMPLLLKLCMTKQASKEQEKQFQAYWLERVEQIALNYQDVIAIKN